MSAPECTFVGEELVAFLDGEQPEAERERIVLHLGTCLTCRREADRLERLGKMLCDLPAVTPSADFEERMWERLAEESPLRGRRADFNAARWGLPALAAAAVLALAIQSVLSGWRDERPRRPTGSPRIAAPADVKRESVPQDVAKAPPAPQPNSLGSKEEPKQLASGHESSPEDLPPELLEHPELFLRLPVVRRLDKLEHYEEVRHLEEGDKLGGLSVRRSLG